MDPRSFWLSVVTIAVVIGIVQGVCAYTIYVERKVAAYVQDRVGPNRVGPYGLLQPIADGLKFLFKEELIPGHVDKLLYLLAPSVAVATAMLAFAVIPFGATSVPPQVPPPLLPQPSENATPQEQAEYALYKKAYKIAFPTGTASDLATPPAAPPANAPSGDFVVYGKAKELYDPAVKAVADYRTDYQWVIAPNIDIGILFSFSITSLAVYAIVLGGYGSNNKYSFLGSLRSSAELISYEIPLGMSILGVLLYSGSLNLEQITAQQVRDGWNGLIQPLAFLLFMTGVFAECNRVPFDLPEAEQELVGGYHTEYSGMKFAFFFLGEYTHMVNTSMLMTFVFLGGWHFPGICAEQSSPAWLKVTVVMLKFVGFIFFYILIRWTIPRFRFDQLMSLAWKVLIPLAMINLLVVMIVRHLQLNQWWLLPISVVIMVGAAWISLRMPNQPIRRSTVPVHNGKATRLAPTAR